MARQRSHKIRRRRRGRFRGIYQFFTVVLAAAAVIAACVVFFRVNEVTVEGAERYTAAEVEAASGIRTGDNLVGLSKSRIASLIRTELPYVEAVSVQRRFPDGVLITVRERAAAASVPASGGRWLISSQGKLLEPHSGQQVLRVEGLEALTPYAGGMLQVAEEDKATLSYVLQLVSELERAELLHACSRLDCGSERQLVLYYDIYELRLPRDGDYEYLLRLLQNVLASEKMPRDVAGVLDFTVKEGEVYFRAAE